MNEFRHFVSGPERSEPLALQLQSLSLFSSKSEPGALKLALQDKMFLMSLYVDEDLKEVNVLVYNYSQLCFVFSLVMK